MSDGHVVRGPFLQTAPPLVGDLRRVDVPMAEQVRDLDEVDPGVEQQGGGRGAEGVGRVDASPHLEHRPVLVRDLLIHRAREAGENPWTRSYIVTTPIGRSPSSASLECRRARNRGPLAIPALARYPETASAAAKCSPIHRRLSPFSWRARVDSSPSWWKSLTFSRQTVPMRAPV